MAWITGSASRPMPKLRTVLWGWRGKRLDAEEIAGSSASETGSTAISAPGLRDLLSRTEVRATVRRTDALLASGRFPYPSPDWPAIPWPPF